MSVFDDIEHDVAVYEQAMKDLDLQLPDMFLQANPITINLQTLLMSLKQEEFGGGVEVCHVLDGCDEVKFENSA